MHAIVTVIGEDKVGIIAGVCTLLSEHNANILDISQTILQGCFTMVMCVDISAATIPFAGLTEELRRRGEAMDVSIRTQREEIFDAMHRI